MSSTIVSAMAPTRTYAPAAANRDARPVPTGPKTARRRPSQDIATRIETSAIRPPRSGAYAIVRVNPTTPASTLAASTRYPTARRVIRCLVTTPRQPRANRHRAPTGPIPASSACIARPHSRRPSGSNRTAPASSHPAASWLTTHPATRRAGACSPAPPGSPTRQARRPAAPRHRSAGRGGGPAAPPAGRSPRSPPAVPGHPAGSGSGTASRPSGRPPGPVRSRTARRTAQGPGHAVPRRSAGTGVGSGSRHNSIYIEISRSRTGRRGWQGRQVGWLVRPDQQHPAGCVIEDEPGRVAQTARPEPGVVAVAGHHEYGRISTGGDHLPLDAPAPADPHGWAAQPLLGHIEQAGFGGGQRGGHGRTGRGDAPAQQPGLRTLHRFDAGGIDDVQEYDLV